MRTFIALELPNKFLEETAQLASQVSRCVKGRFLPKSTYHLTLAFLGETEEVSVAKVISALDRISREYTAPLLHPNGLGKFGKPTDATLFLELQAIESLTRLTSGVRNELNKPNISFDTKKFRPHITLARRASIPKDRFSDLYFPSPEIATEVTFFKSILKPEGAEYKTLYSVVLNQPKN